MGTGARMERAAYGAARGESAAILEHLTALIPIQEKQAESELKIRELAFEQELKQAKKLNLLADQVQPIFVTQEPKEQKQNNYLWYIGLGILAVLLIKKGKIL